MDKGVDSSGVLDVMRNHQSVNAVSGEVLHVAVEKTCPAAVQHAIAIANHGPDGRASAGQRPFANAGWNPAEPQMRVRVFWACRALIRRRELGNRDFFFIRMTVPRAIHKTPSF